MTKHSRKENGLRLGKKYWALKTWQERTRFIVMLSNADVVDVGMYCPDVCNHVHDLIKRGEKDKIFQKRLYAVRAAAAAEKATLTASHSYLGKAFAARRLAQ